jgi:uncharacterized membrane protein HdeD (DUF308 family)
MDINNKKSAVARQPWWLLFIEGILAIVLGGTLLWAPSKTQQNTWVILVIILGLYWFVSGIFTLARLFRNQKQWGWKLFISIISILAGGYILVYPAASAGSLPSIILLVLGVVGCMQGVARLLAAFAGGGWVSAILGILMLILGIILLVNFANPSYGLALLYIAAVTIFIMGFVLLYKSLRHQPNENTSLYWV